MKPLFSWFTHDSFVRYEVLTTEMMLNQQQKTIEVIIRVSPSTVQKLHAIKTKSYHINVLLRKIKIDNHMCSSATSDCFWLNDSITKLSRHATNDLI
jgi:hypothetical protein